MNTGTTGPGFQCRNGMPDCRLSLDRLKPLLRCRHRPKIGGMALSPGTYTIPWAAAVLDGTITLNFGVLPSSSLFSSLQVLSLPARTRLLFLRDLDLRASGKRTWFTITAAITLIDNAIVALPVSWF